MKLGAIFVWKGAQSCLRARFAQIHPAHESCRVYDALEDTRLNCLFSINKNFKSTNLIDLYVLRYKTNCIVRSYCVLSFSLLYPPTNQNLTFRRHSWSIIFPRNLRHQIKHLISSRHCSISFYFSGIIKCNYHPCPKSKCWNEFESQHIS